MSGIERRARGRPELTEEERASARITLRLYADDAELLALLVAKLELGEGAVLREALRAFARQKRVR